MKWTIQRCYHILAKYLMGSGPDARLKIATHQSALKVAAYMVALVVCLPSSVNAATYVINMNFDEDSGKVYFEPQRLEISLGDEIIWVQRDGDNGHNVVSYPNRIPAGTDTFKSPMLNRTGTHWSKVFDKIGTYEYHCHPHEAAGMRGVIVVERESHPHEFRKAKAKEHEHSPENSHVGDGESLPHELPKANATGHGHSLETSQIVERESLPHEFEKRNPSGPTVHPRLPR